MPELAPEEQIELLRQEFIDKATDYKHFPQYRPQALEMIDALLDMYNIIQLRLDADAIEQLDN